MVVIKHGSGTEHPAGDDCAVIRFTAWKRDGSLASTSGPSGQSAVQCLTTAIPGISEALESMVDGEERRLWVPAELAFAAHIAHHGNKHLDAAQDPPADLTIDLQLIRVLKAPLPPPDLKTPPRTATRTPSGVAILVLKQGAGTKHPTRSDWVTLDYSGWTTDGKLFETTIMSGHPGDFLLSTTLPGWRDALSEMVTGEKARVWIPAALAYGNRPSETMVPAGDLVYEIELLAVR
jgi:peptidylprolyl isomerase